LLFGRSSEAADLARVAANELSDVEKALRIALEANSDSVAIIEEHMLTTGSRIVVEPGRVDLGEADGRPERLGDRPGPGGG
jgi:hypothetical protein